MPAVHCSIVHCHHIVTNLLLATRETKKEKNLYCRICFCKMLILLLLFMINRNLSPLVMLFEMFDKFEIFYVLIFKLQFLFLSLVYSGYKQIRVDTEYSSFDPVPNWDTNDIFRIGLFKTKSLKSHFEHKCFFVYFCKNFMIRLPISWSRICIKKEFVLYKPNGIYFEIKDFFLFWKSQNVFT